MLARGSSESPAAARAAIAEVEEFCSDTGYPQTRFDPSTLAAAEQLRGGTASSRGMGVLLAKAVPPVAPVVVLVAGPELFGRVVGSRWPVGGPRAGLLGPSG